MYKQIGSDPDLTDLWMQNFFYQGKLHDTLFHAVVDVPSHLSRYHAFLVYAETVNTLGPTGSDTLWTLLGLAFGVYAFQHRDKIMYTLRRLPVGTRFAISGVQTDCHQDFIHEYFATLGGIRGVALECVVVNSLGSLSIDEPTSETTIDKVNRRIKLDMGSDSDVFQLTNEKNEDNLC